MAQTQNFTWDQGADLTIQLIYKEGVDAASAVVVDLSTAYQVRMDLVVPSSKSRIYTFNSASIADVDSTTVGAQPDSVIEGTLSSGAGGTPNINITVPRTLTLPGGVVYDQMQLNTKLFNYDLFLRNTNTNTQVKILTGSVTVTDSNTLWL